ncbi:MAG: conjugal transfer protein TrbH [Pseudomonadota bacterium]
MRQLILTVLFPSCLAGCATTNSDNTYGNFIPQPLALYDRELAEDAVKRLSAVYPPAITRFDLNQATPDIFGKALVESLRNKGYALLELSPSTTSSKIGSTDNAAPNPGENLAGQPGKGISITYVLDMPINPGWYRVTLFVGQQSFTRAYLAQDGSLHPAGAWVRKE